MNHLTKEDYITILQYYSIPYHNLTKFELEHQAENILANKLCRCIKKVEKSSKGYCIHR